MAPAGNPEKLLFAYLYGADSAYIGGGEFSLRAGSEFDFLQLQDAVKLARSLGKKLYIAVNSFMRNVDIAKLPDFLDQLASIKPDALIISDPGVLDLAKEYAPGLPVHISTQVNTTNWRSARFWKQYGANRVNLSRELSIAEGREISSKSGMETEVFVHGAMCISFSGRCLLSSFMTNRSGNQGNCSHPCRYSYTLTEAKRPDEQFPIEEDKRGSYILNSRDLCLIDHIPQLCDGNFAALKIEGRNKSIYYVANVVRTYRAAIDAFFDERDKYFCREEWKEELAKVSHRQYTSAFAVSEADDSSMRYHSSGYVRGYDFCAIVSGFNEGMLHLQQRNHIALGEELEIIFPDGSNSRFTASQIFDQDGLPLDAARHPKETILIPYMPEREIRTPLVVRRPAK